VDHCSREEISNRDRLATERFGTLGIRGAGVLPAIFAHRRCTERREQDARATMAFYGFLVGAFGAGVGAATGAAGAAGATE
jgi:hypothetical protein